MPFTCHTTALFARLLVIAENCWLANTPTVAAEGVTVTLGFEELGVIVRIAAAESRESACEVAVIVAWREEFWMEEGAVYTPLADMDPFDALQTTVVFFAPLTVAVN